MDTNSIIEILYQYVVEGHSQQQVAAHMGIGQTEVSTIVREYGFNKVHMGGYNSGQDRGKYKRYKGITVTKQMVAEFVLKGRDEFEELLEEYVEKANRQRKKDMMHQQQEMEAIRKRQAAQEAEEARRRQRAEEERLHNEFLRKREEEWRRQEQERLHREQQQRIKEKAEQAKKQEQIRNNVHKEWLTTANRFLEQRNYEEALRYAEASHDLHPMKGNIFVSAVASYHVGQYERAYNLVKRLLMNNVDFREQECRILRAKIYHKCGLGSTFEFLNDVDFALSEGMNVDELLLLYAEKAIDKGNERQIGKAADLYYLFIHQERHMITSYFALAQIYYKKRMWKQVVESYNEALDVCDRTNDWDTYNTGIDYWKKGISSYHLGDVNTAYFCFRNGLPIDLKLPFQQNEECLPSIEEEQIFFECLNLSGDRESMNYYKKELARRKKFLSGGMTAHHFYGDRFTGLNYKYDKHGQMISVSESISEKLFKWIGR